jgi:hypothetical protein
MYMMACVVCCDDRLAYGVGYAQIIDDPRFDTIA